MARVTICIPVHRPGEILAQTFRSVLRQAFDDFVVHVGVEPAGDPDLDRLREQAGDSRFEFRLNDAVLGWAGNIASLLATVRTPEFIILPHDDLIHPAYLARLTSLLDTDPQAVVAYSDMLYFGRSFGCRRLRVDNACLPDRIWSFYLEGAEAVPWRGVTRATVLSGGRTFPNNPHEGFAVECEWAQHLLVRGKALRLPEPLYFKRLFDPTHPTVSTRWSTATTRAQRLDAMRDHRLAMLSGIPDDLPGGARERLVLACEVAMLRRLLQFSRNEYGFDDRWLGRIATVRAGIESLDAPSRDALGTRLHVCLARNEMIAGNLDRAVRLAEQAVALDPRHDEARVFLAHVLLAAGDQAAALQHACAAMEIYPQGAPNIGALRAAAAGAARG